MVSLLLTSERISERVMLVQEWVLSNLGMIFTTAGLKKEPTVWKQCELGGSNGNQRPQAP